MGAPVDIGTLITRTPGVRGGRACMAGTGVSVMRIVQWSQMGWSPRRIARGYPHVPLAGIYAALAYYHANRDEIDAEIAEERAAAEQFEKELAVKR